LYFTKNGNYKLSTFYGDFQNYYTFVDEYTVFAMIGFIFDIKRFTLHDGPGIRTTVFFKGCPLRCAWCHNPEGIDFHPIEWTHERNFDGQSFTDKETIGRSIEVDDIFHIIKRDNNFYRESGGGVTFSGGEPLAHAPFLLALLQRCKAEGIHSCVDTSGYASNEDFLLVSENCNLLLFDLKHADNTKHLEGTGTSNNVIINNIKSRKQLSTPVWLRLPMIPDYNMDTQSWNQMLTLLDDIKSDQIRQIHLLPYHRISDHKYLKCGMEYQMKGAGNIQKADLLPYYQQLSGRGWEKIVIGG
jgi:pyruvate formate lyase activating enzyme